MPEMHEEEVDMHQIAVLLVRVLSPALGVLLGLLGFATLGANLLGWFLFVAGVLYAAGAVIVAYVLRRNFWEAQATGIVTHAEAGDRSFWVLAAAIAAVFYLAPLEFLYMRMNWVRTDWLELAGACLAGLGALVFLWARRSATGSAGGALIKQAGPYRFVRHPAYAGYLLAGLGLVLGYASVWGAAALLLLLVPAVLWRVQVEEKMLTARLGAQYGAYASKTKRLIPRVW